MAGYSAVSSLFGLLFFDTKNFCFRVFLVALCAEIQAPNITLTEVSKSVFNFSHKYEELKSSVVIRKCFPRGYENIMLSCYDGRI